MILMNRTQKIHYYFGQTQQKNHININIYQVLQKPIQYKRHCWRQILCRARKNYYLMESLCKSNVGQVNIIPKVESPPVPRTVYEKKKKTQKLFVFLALFHIFKNPLRLEVREFLKIISKCPNLKIDRFLWQSTSSSEGYFCSTYPCNRVSLFNSQLDDNIDIIII